ncbi:MAG: (4Fe-4S)-binding protein [candidate division Zixibacteria bacterium]|nr:(4Fe-4S)-binding protein [candidate division Zixibacteria bacterium]MCI0595145.1 (4Fe-4S)-binding protein [candidate division Zixibacteria bacterium]
MKDITRKYTNGEVTILWQPALCFHSAKCFLGLPSVFDPTKRPWVNPEGADMQRMIEQVKQCPSGALSYFLNGEEKKGK